ncbi:hypothetical protein DM02DRAFT_21654 [Periconia macrospinosa]|uniref:Uncharacterized protein n=1 Tax=Periconia macrospinosa TaxID=97972 RepID=A0A2V1DLH8_9PLEO|nr:hypothetical protein DM02DRAFT_21654 [Periconia macrospinosa]
MSSNHSRNVSEEAAASPTGSYSIILDHLLQYPGSYEIPLRTMYTLNCAPRAQPLPRDRSRAPTPSGSPTSGQNPWNEAESATVNFTSQLMSHINSLPHQPSSLPPSFIVSFVSRVFHPSLSLVDFSQALTALDYLRDLENRRKKEMVAAYARVHINPESFEADVEAISERYPGIALWANNLEGKNRKAELYYAKLWLGMRRWIMINELSLQPFNKLNCMGMLNTLLPPQPDKNSKLPSPLLNHQALKQERESFFHYIQQVQRKGPHVLASLTEGEKTKWEVVQQEVDKYIRVAKNIIDDCMATLGTEDFQCVEEPRKGKKTDSGVSFGSGIRPSTESNIEALRPISPAPSYSTSKSSSTLVRLTREFKRMRVKARPDVEEMIKMDQPLPSDSEQKGKMVKKVRSLVSLRGSNPSSVSLAGSRKGSEPFPVEEMKRARMQYEASLTK